MSDVLQVTLKGAMLLGAGRSRETHDITLRRPDGTPYIPASALKGAIREQLVRMSSEADAKRIFGGRGFRQDTEPQEAPSDPERPERVGGGYTRIFLSDAELSPTQAAPFLVGRGYTLRPHVSIDRRARRALDQRLFQHEVVGSRGQSLVFRAPVDLALLTPEDRRLFAAALHAVFAIGSSRSRGLGWVDCQLASEDPGAEEPPRCTVIPDASELEVVFEALEPLSLGALPFVGNFQPTLDYLSASTVRGAVVTAAMRVRGKTTDQSTDATFRALLLDPDTCVRFGDAAPVGGQATDSPSIAPLTARVHKYGGDGAGLTDTLIRDYVQRLLADQGFFRVEMDRVHDDKGGAERAVRPSGRWLSATRPRRRVMTRLALDPKTARGKDGALYSVELLERGTTFVATVRNAGPEARRLLVDAAAADLRAGHGRGQGYGRLRIVAARKLADEPLRERVRAFDEKLRSSITSAGEASGLEIHSDEGHYVAALLVTDLLPGPATEGASAEEALHSALGLRSSRLLHADVRAGQRGGFDTTKHHPRPFEPMVRAGSVLLLSVPQLDREVFERMEAIENHGAGEGRDRGFGAVRFSDPIHCKGDSR